LVNEKGLNETYNPVRKATMLRSIYGLNWQCDLPQSFVCFFWVISGVFWKNNGVFNGPIVLIALFELTWSLDIYHY